MCAIEVWLGEWGQAEILYVTGMENLHDRYKVHSQEWWLCWKINVCSFVLECCLNRSGSKLFERPSYITTTFSYSRNHLIILHLHSVIVYSISWVTFRVVFEAQTSDGEGPDYWGKCRLSAKGSGGWPKPVTGKIPGIPPTNTTLLERSKIVGEW